LILAALFGITACETKLHNLTKKDLSNHKGSLLCVSDDGEYTGAMFNNFKLSGNYVINTDTGKAYWYSECHRR
jgi:hypothetical protein